MSTSPRATAALATWTALAAMALSGCTGPPPQAPDVAVTFYPLAFLATEITGPGLDIVTIIPSGVEPHDYEASPSDARAIVDARAVVIQGANFEGWLESLRADASDPSLIVATAGIDLRPNPDADEADQMPNDPHTWLDPVLAQAMATNIERGLATTFPEEAETFAANADALRARLATLHAEFEAALADCTIPVIITNHAAYDYLGARYGFSVLSVNGLDPNDQPGPQTIRDLSDKARQYGIEIIFFEELASPAVVQAIADQVGAETRVLSPVEGVPDDAPAGTDYFSLMRVNLDNLQDAMKCR